MRVTLIRISRRKGEPREELESGELVADMGLEGDRYAKGGARQVSLMDSESERAARGAHGLCTDRFAANLLTEGLDYDDLKTGDILDFGACALEITELGKECYPECPIASEGGVCPIPASSAFAKVARAGKIRLNNTINLTRKAKE